MPSHHSQLAPARSSAPPRNSLRELSERAGFRIKLKPRRDAMTRVRHDMRSLLQSVVGYADLLAEPRYGALSSEQERFVDNVREAAEHLRELVDTCIELSRPDNDNGARLEPPVVLLGQCLQRVRSTMAARSLCCDVKIASEVASRSLMLDITPFERALLGLASVLTRDGAVALELAADARMMLRLRASDAQDVLGLVALDSLEDQLSNRDFVRLKLGEVLLSRVGFTMLLSASLDVIELHYG